MLGWPSCDSRMASAGLRWPVSSVTLGCFSTLILCCRGKRLEHHLPTLAEACPRRADAYLVAIAGEYPGTPIAEVCQGIRVGLQQARVAVRD